MHKNFLNIKNTIYMGNVTIQFNKMENKGYMAILKSKTQSWVEMK